MAIVPVKISFIRKNKVLNKYKDDIAIDLSAETWQGKEHMQKLFTLVTERKVSIEDALFTLAADAVYEGANGSISRKPSKVITSKGMHNEIQVRVEFNGEITYKNIQNLQLRHN